MTDVNLQIGDVSVQRLEEVYGPAFPADMFLPSWDPGIREDLGPDTVNQHIEAGTDLALASVHTWVIRTPQKTILVDTCNGNHKERAIEDMAMLDTDWLDRLAAIGVQPSEVDAVVCTHLHLDHVGWNTTLDGNDWAPTFPNATYFVNEAEFEFWDPRAGDFTGKEINLNVFEDSVLPVFDRELMQLWRGDGIEVDDSLRLELAAGHTPGHAIGWIESKGERGLLSGDSMHSAIQVYRPDWNSGFCIDGEASAATRRSVLERCVESNALLLPAHFSAPHAFRVQERGDAFAVIDAP